LLADVRRVRRRVAHARRHPGVPAPQNEHPEPRSTPEDVIVNPRKPARRLQYHRILGARLHAIRAAKKIDRASLVENHGFTHAMLCKMERGTRGPSLESLLTLCDAYGVDVYRVLVEVAQQYRGERLSLNDGEYHFASADLRVLDALALFAGFPEDRLPAGGILPIGRRPAVSLVDHGPAESGQGG
jgi:transcriptional regulator with XRE-family HTH domain